MSWLEALKNLDAAATQQIEMPTAAFCAAELSEPLTQQGAKRAKEELLSLLAPRYLRYSRTARPPTGTLALRHTKNLERTTDKPAVERLWGTPAFGGIAISSLYE